MNLFDRFKDTHEEGFRETFIKPLLIQLGFIGITNKHGRQEFGKDFVFSELDRFGTLRHMIVQAKHEKSINQGIKVDAYFPRVLPLISRQFVGRVLGSAAVFGGLETEELENFPLHGR